MDGQVTLPFRADALATAAAASRRPAAGAAARGLLARAGAWLRRMNETAALREMAPERARDIGLAPGCRDRAPEGYAMDPRPLWGIGLTPRPMDVDPALVPRTPLSRRRTPSHAPFPSRRGPTP